VESVAEGLRLSDEYGIQFLPCLEFDTVYIDYDLHILGYFVDHTSPDCGAWMEEIFEAKLGQTKIRVEKLAGLGFSIDFDEVMQISEGRLPTGATYVKALSGKPENREDPRVRAFIDGDRSDSPSVNFYLDYLKAGRPAFVPLDIQQTIETMEKIKKLGGIPIHAHPSDTPDSYIHDLVDAGLEGLEVYSSYHDNEMIEKFLKICRDRGLLVTAGSDFHGKKIKPKVFMGVEIENEREIVESLVKAREK
jgi:predicted metal-dependent phosphoesterase TrpH